MDAADYERELENLRMRLATELGRDELPDAIWGYVMKLGLPYDAITGGDETSWQDLVKAAKDRLRESLEVAGAVVPPGRGEGEGAHAPPHQIIVEPSENTSKRAQAFSELAAALAENHPDIEYFRRKYLGDRLLTDNESRTFLDRQGGPYGTSRIMTELRKLAEKLVLTYRWREGDAIWFVLTGYKPPVTLLDVSVSINQTSKFRGWPKQRIPGSSPPKYLAAIPRPADYHPSTARVTVTADVWVDAREIGRVFRDTQRQILGGDAKPVEERTLEVVKFIARRMRERDGETWEERRKAWNQTCPKEWRYKDYRGFRQTFKRFANRLHKPYNLPNFPVPEPTPYQAYRDDLIGGRTGER